MTPFGLILPERTLFGRGCRNEAAQRVAGLGQRVLLVRGRSVGWVDDLAAVLRSYGLAAIELFSGGEPTLDQLRDLLEQARRFRPDCVLAVGGGATIDLGKAIAALARSERDPLVHFEVIGEGKPITPDPLPFIAMPTTSGTGAEATKNAVIAVPEQAIKVSLRDDRMIPDLAIVDPGLTDGAPKQVTLATGLDAITQLIESYLSRRANPVTDALCRGALPGAIAALACLMETEDADARDSLSRASYVSGIALANVGLGVVHGLAAVIGGRGGAHGAVCGRLLPAALTVNERVAREKDLDNARFRQIDSWLTESLGGASGTGPQSLRRFVDQHGLSTLEALGCSQEKHYELARLAMNASSTRTNPVTLNEHEIAEILHEAG